MTARLRELEGDHSIFPSENRAAIIVIKAILDKTLLVNIVQNMLVGTGHHSCEIILSIWYLKAIGFAIGKDRVWPWMLHCTKKTAIELN